MKQMSQMKLIVGIVVLGILSAATAQAACIDQLQCETCRKESGCKWFAYGIEMTNYLGPKPVTEKVFSGVGRCVEAKCDNCKFSSLDSLTTFTKTETNGAFASKPFVAELPAGEQCAAKLDTPKTAYEKQTCHDCVKSGNEWCQFDVDIKYPPPTTTTTPATTATATTTAVATTKKLTTVSTPKPFELKRSGGLCMPKGSASCKTGLLFEMPSSELTASAKSKCSGAFSKYNIVGSFSLMAVVMALYNSL